MAFQDLVDQVLQNIQLSTLIGKYVELKQRGSNFFGLCPFHQEKSPSFSVNDDKRIFHCFGCGESGNAISFLMKYKEIPFKRALLEAASEAGIAVENLNLEQMKKQESLRKKVLLLNRRAATRYHENLLKNPSNPALNYLKKKRKVSGEIIEKFFLGYAPDSWDFISTDAQKLPPLLLKESGLFSKGQNGFYDRFKNKIIFPIFDIRGDIIAFGSRVLDDSKPKYINSPETSFFKKKEVLYGLNFAVEPIRRETRAYVVEGYIDVLKMHEAGLENTVAPLGTAFGSDHVKLLARYAREGVLVFDGDEVGRKAAYRSVEVALREGFPVKVVELPEGQDPDDLIGELGAKEFRCYLKTREQSWEDFLLNPVRSQKDALARRREVVTVLKLFLDKDPVIVSAFLEKLAFVLGTELSEIQGYFQKMKKQGPRTSPARQQKKEVWQKPAFSSGRHPETELVFLLLNNPELYLEARESITEAFFTEPEAAEIFSTFSRSFEDNDFQEDLFFAHLPEKWSREIGKRLGEKKYRQEPEKQFQDIFIFLQLVRLKEKKKSLLEEIRNAEKEGDWEVLKGLSEELHSLSREEEELENKRKKFLT